MTIEDPVSETAKAVQEVAKTTGKAISAGEKFGGFISQYVEGSIEQGMGIFEDKLKYMRWERQVRLMQRAEQLSKEIGLTQPTRSIPLKLAIPLLEAASLEDDDSLQDLWTHLLVNAANAESHINLQRAYIEILKQITSLEALVLQKIYSLPYEDIRHGGVELEKLPHEATAGNFDSKRNQALLEPPEEVKLALSNLERLGCLFIERSMAGGELYKKIHPTLLGKSFVEACTLQKQT